MVNKILQDVVKTTTIFNVRITSRSNDYVVLTLASKTEALAALQFEAEKLIVKYFETAGVIAKHGNRETVEERDTKFVRDVLGMFTGLVSSSATRKGSGPADRKKTEESEGEDMAEEQ
jgi:histone H3/H4